MPTSNERKMLSSNEALKELKQYLFNVPCLLGMVALTQVVLYGTKIILNHILYDQSNCPDAVNCSKLVVCPPPPPVPPPLRHKHTQDLQSQQTRSICIAFVQCWTYVEDVGSKLYKCYTNVLCLLGYDKQFQV